MAIGAITTGLEHGQIADHPIFVQKLSFLGDASYPTGGTAAFEATVQTALGKAVEIVSIIADDCDGFVPVYDKAADTLKVFFADYDAVADGPLIEVASMDDLSGSTFNITVIGR